MLNVVIDLSHHNSIQSFEKVKSSGILGIIHKATEGLTFKDKKYNSRRDIWQTQMNLLWGAYHFAAPGNPRNQASHFLDTVQPNDFTLLVLDFESNINGNCMSLKDAEIFVQQVQNDTGRYPGIYSGFDLREQIGKRTDSILKNCFLWAARYGGRPIVPPNWNTWTFWQYTDGNITSRDKNNNVLPRTVSGIGPVDRNLFNGKLEQLLKIWNVPAVSVESFTDELPDFEGEELRA